MVENPPRKQARAWSPRRLAAAVLTASLLLCVATLASAQSIGVGFGLGVPFSTYVEDESQAEFRAAPEPGYYPILRDRSSAAGSSNGHVSLILEDTALIPYFDDLEIRFDWGLFGWSEAIVTHTGCSPIAVIDKQFDDAIVRYAPIDHASCTAGTGYDAVTNISALQLPALQHFGIGLSQRYRFFTGYDWLLFGAVGAGMSIVTFDAPSAAYFLGGNLTGGAGVSYMMGRVVSVEFEARSTLTITEAPDTMQNRLNHGPQVGGNILSGLIEVFGFADFQLALRFSLSSL